MVSKNTTPSLVAIDDGYAQIKVVSSNGHFSFNSSVINGTIGSLDGKGAIGAYETDDGRTRMTVSDSIAGEKTQFDGFHISAMDRVLINHALVRAGYGGKPVHLYAGLPVQDFFIGEAKNVDYIERKIENLKIAVRNLVPGGDAVAELVKIDIGCQAVAAFVDYAVDDEFNDRDVPVEKVAIIDIGGRTTDIALILDGQKFLPARSGTENIGVLDVQSGLERLIKSQFGVNDSYSVSALDHAIRTGYHRMWGKDVDVSELVNKAKSASEASLKNLIIRKLGQASDIDAVVFVGGGAKLFENVLKELFPHNGFISDNPEFANARGLYKYANIYKD